MFGCEYCAAVLIWFDRYIEGIDSTRNATISVLSIPINGRNTGMVAPLSVQPMACMVWLATCPRLSPVINAPQSPFRHLFGNTHHKTAHYNSKQFLRAFVLYLFLYFCERYGPHLHAAAVFAHFRCKRTTLCSARSLVYGGLAKWMAVSSTPRLAIDQAATGLSIPPLINIAAFPPVPTGIPPAPGSAPPRIYAP